MKTYPLVLCIFLFNSLLIAQDPTKELPVNFVGHMGASYLAPENTLAAMELAINQGADSMIRTPKSFAVKIIPLKKLPGKS